MSREISHHALIQRCSRLRKRLVFAEEQWNRQIAISGRMLGVNLRKMAEVDKYRDLWRAAYKDKDLALTDQLWWRGNRVRLERLIDESEATNDILRQERDSLKHQLREMTEMRDASSRKLSEAIHRVTQLGQELSTMREERDSARNETAELEAEVLNLREEIRKMVAREQKRKWWQAWR